MVKNNIIGIVVGLVVVGIVAAIAFNQPEDGGSVAPQGTEGALSAPSTQVRTPQEFAVVYDVSGFSPKTVTVKKGDIVVFQNKTGKRVSVASDDHPTHLLYPEFDQYKTDARGKDEFRFTFEKTGTWGYHDHLNASMTGTVAVTD